MMQENREPKLVTSKEIAGWSSVGQSKSHTGDLKRPDVIPIVNRRITNKQWSDTKIPGKIAACYRTKQDGYQSDTTTNKRFSLGTLTEVLRDVLCDLPVTELEPLPDAKLVLQSHAARDC